MCLQQVWPAKPQDGPLQIKQVPLLYDHLLSLLLSQCITSATATPNSFNNVPFPPPESPLNSLQHLFYPLHIKPICSHISTIICRRTVTFQSWPLSSFVSSSPTVCSTLSPCVPNHFSSACQTRRTSDFNFFRWKRLSLGHLTEKENLCHFCLLSFPYSPKPNQSQTYYEILSSQHASSYFHHYRRPGLLQQHPDWSLSPGSASFNSILCLP